MNMHRLKSIALAASVTMMALVGAHTFAANEQEGEADAAEAAPPKPTVPVSAVLDVAETKIKNGRESQVRIDRIADQTRDLLQDYKTVMKQVDGLRVYNARLEKQIASQIRRIKELESSIDEATVIARQIMPLTIRMIDGLEKFVELDMPFLMDERQQRIEFLRDNMDRSDLTISEKFRQVLEAYKIENEYGRKINTYKGTVDVGGTDRDVNFLQVGRIALVYQTTDNERTGMWDKNAGKWVEVGDEYRGAITQGLRIARKQASIDLLKLPIPAPEAGEK